MTAHERTEAPQIEAETAGIAGMSRRTAIRLAGAGVGAVVLQGALGASTGPANVYGQTPETAVRLAAVNTPEFGGLLDALLATFTSLTGTKVAVHSGEDVYEQARAGNADIVLSHYGHRGVEAFITEGLGQWPRTVFANQLALVGPSGDPARVRGLTDVVQAFSRIVGSNSIYVANTGPGITYVENILWEAAGRPPKGSWYRNDGTQNEVAMTTAARIGAYSIWGVFPFLRLQQLLGFDLQPLVLGDPLLQRIMGTTVVNPLKIAGVNSTGALALQQYLLTPATQAQIRAFRVPGVDQQLWWPAGRNNDPMALPR